MSKSNNDFLSRYSAIGRNNCDNQSGGEKVCWDNAYIIGRVEKRRNWFISKYLSLLASAFIGAFLLIYFAPEVVWADYFYPSGETVNCNIAQSTSVTVNRLPENIVKDDSITYDSHLVVGYSADFPQNHTITDIADITYPDARRYLGVADRVSAPPDAVLDVGYFVFNYSGHQVDVVNGYFFFSKTDQLGDWGRFGVQGPTRSVSYLINGSWVTKVGKTIYKDNWGSWPVSSFSAPPSGLLIGQMTLGEPIQYETTGVSYAINESGEVIVNISVIVRNVAGYDVSNIEYKHGLFNEIFSLSSYGNINDNWEIEYSINLGKNYGKRINIGQPEIVVNSMHTECLLEAGQSWSSTDPDTRSIVTYRDDQNAGAWLGAQIDLTTQPSGDSMCITMIPYTKHLKTLYIDVLPQLRTEITLSDNDELSAKTLNTFVGQTYLADVSVVDTVVDGSNIEARISFDEDKIFILDTCGGRIVGEEVIWENLNIPKDEEWSCELSIVSKEIAQNLVFDIFAEIHDDGVESNLDSAIVNVGDLPKVTVEKTMNSDNENGIINATVSFIIQGLGDGRSIVAKDMCEDCPETYDYIGEIPLREAFYPMTYLVQNVSNEAKNVDQKFNSEKNIGLAEENGERNGGNPEVDSTGKTYLLSFRYIVDEEYARGIPRLINNCFIVYASDINDSENMSDLDQHNTEIAKSCVNIMITVDGAIIMPDWEVVPQDIAQEDLPDQSLLPDVGQDILSFFDDIRGSLINNQLSEDSDSITLIEQIQNLPYLLFENSLEYSGFAFTDKAKWVIFILLISFVAVILFLVRKKIIKR